MTPLKEVNDIVYRIVGSCMEVHKTIGPGLGIDIYKKALEIEFPTRELKFESDKAIDVVFKDTVLGNITIDFLVNDAVVMMLRAQEELKDFEIQQVLRILQMTGNKMGILVNFGNVKIQYKRVLPSRGQKEGRKDHPRMIGYREMGRTREDNPVI